MNLQKIKKIAQFILFLGIGIFLVWFSIKDFQTEDIQAIKLCLQNLLNPKGVFFIFLCFFFEIASHYTRALRSIIMIEPLGYKVKKSSSFFSIMTCYLGNLAFPRLGEVLRCTYLKRCENVPFEKTLGTVVTERVVDIVLWLILFFVAIFINSSLLYKLSLDDNGTTVGTLLNEKFFSLATNYTLYILIFALVLLFVVIYILRNWWKKFSFVKKITNFIIGIWQGLISIKDIKKPALFILYSILIWIFYFLSTYASFFAFDFLNHLGPFPALSILAFSTISFLIAQGGLGAYPLMVAGILTLYQIDYNQGFTVGMTNWLIQTLASIIFGVIALVYISQIEKRKK